jgi:hypothetical protein
MTAKQTRQRHPTARPQAKTLDRLIGIVGAGRQMTAVLADEW